MENFVEKVESRNDSPFFYGVYNRLAPQSAVLRLSSLDPQPPLCGGRVTRRSDQKAPLSKGQRSGGAARSWHGVAVTEGLPAETKVIISFPFLSSPFFRPAGISKAAVPKHGGWGSGLIYAAGVSVFSSAEGSSSVAAGTMISLISV